MTIRTRGIGDRGEILDADGHILIRRKDLVSKAKEMRQSPTLAEKILWERLRGNKLRGLKFYRQMPIDRFIVDFCCPAQSLIIELDGSVHDEEERQMHDKERERRLKEMGFSILRFKNEEIIRNLHHITQTILKYCST